MHPEKIQFTGEILQLLQQIKGVKQTAIAKQLHISQQAYSKIEHSKHIDSSQFIHILKTMNYPVDSMEAIQSLIKSLSAIYQSAPGKE